MIQVFAEQHTYEKPMWSRSIYPPYRKLSHIMEHSSMRINKNYKEILGIPLRCSVRRWIFSIFSSGWSTLRQMERRNTGSRHMMRRIVRESRILMSLPDSITAENLIRIWIRRLWKRRTKPPTESQCPPFKRTVWKWLYVLWINRCAYK